MSFLSKMNKSKLVAAGVALALGAMLTVGCGGGDKKDAKAPAKAGSKAIYMGMFNSPTSFNPLLMPDASGRIMIRYIYESLLGQPEPYKFTPHLAQSFESQDGQNYVVKLNPKAKWTDGKPITADDVVFTYNLVANPKMQTSRGRYVAMLEGTTPAGKLVKGDKIPGLEAKDATTVVFKTKAPMDPNYVKCLLGFDIPIVPKHIWEKLDPATIAKSDVATKPTVTSGAYKLVKFVPGNSIELEANKDYYLGTPKTDRFFVKIENATNIVTDLKAGKLNMIAGGGVGTAPIKDIPMLEKEPNLVVKHYPAPAPQLLEINNSKYNVKFRRAVTMGINRQIMCDKLYNGFAYVTPSLYTKDSPVYDANVKALPYDVEAAKKELKESGYDTSKEIVLQVPIGNVPREQSADLIQQNLAAIGLKVKLQKMDFPTVIGNARKGNFDMLLIGLAPSIDPDHAAYYSKGSANNYAVCDDPKLSAMFAEGMAQPNLEKRKVVYSNIQKHLVENAIDVTLYATEYFTIQSKNLVGGIKPYWEGSWDDVHTWELK